jgi:protein TonB
MTILWAALVMISLCIVGTYGFLYFVKEEKRESEVITTAEQLINSRTRNFRYRTPIFLFACFVSLFFVSWSFDAQYTRLIEKKIKDTTEIKKDTMPLIMISLNTPPPPPRPKIRKLQRITNNKTIKTEDIKVELPEVKITEDENDQSKLTNTEQFSDEKNSPGSEEGDPNGDPKGIENGADIDTNLYFIEDVSEIPQFAGGQDALNKYMSEKLRNVYAPRNANGKYIVHVNYVIEADGSISNVTLVKNNVELDDATKKVITKSFLDMPKWTPAKLDKTGKTVRVMVSQKLPLTPR